MDYSPWGLKESDSTEQLSLSDSKTEQDHMVLAYPIPPLPPTISSACLLPVKNCSYKKISLIREVRNAETKGNSPETLYNNNAVIKQSQGPLIFSQGL